MRRACRTVAPRDVTPQRCFFRAAELGPELIHEGASAIHAL